MARNRCLTRVAAMHVGVVLLLGAWSHLAFAHCDTLDGPVVQAARIALESGDVTPILKWVSADDEGEIRAAFRRTLSVRSEGPEARDLADQYLFETLVRVHRSDEGAPYTGLKPSDSVDPAVALADAALESGSIDELVQVMTDAVVAGIRERFERASHAREHANRSVAEGREFVRSYVLFTHYVEGLHSLVRADAHDHGGATNADHGGHD